MLPLESHFESNDHSTVRPTDPERLVPTYNYEYTVYRYELTQSWCEYALLHTSSPRRKRHNIDANIHQDESSP